MRRLLTLPLLICWLVFLGLGDALAQQGGVDTIYYYPDLKTKSETVIKGTIAEESPVGIKVKVDKSDVKIIPGMNIVWISYRTKSVDGATFREGYLKENKASQATRETDKKNYLNEAMTKFQAVASQVQDSPTAQRFLSWKVADVKVRLAELEPDNKEATKSAIDALSKYAEKNPQGWEVVPCMVALSQLQEREGNIEAARKAHEFIAKIPGVPTELKNESELMVLQLLLRAKLYTDAETKAKELATSISANDPQSEVVRLYLIETQLAQNKLDGVEASLKKSLQSSVDPRSRAMAHAFLGDYYRLKKQEEDALWEYLKVDVLYPQEKDEQAKALYWLSQLFESVQGSKIRAAQARERLLDKAYAGTEYGRKMAAEKPAKP